MSRPAGRPPARVLVTAGPTQEPIDPVRYLSNRSTGTLGYAVARGAAVRGHSVTLISGPTALQPPVGVRFVPVMTARQMLAAVRRAFAGCDWLVMTAAVADWRPRRARSTKWKTSTGGRTAQLVLVRNPDIVSTVARRKGRRLVVGCALETGDPVAAGRAKLRAKRLDLLLANQITPNGHPFGSQDVRVALLDRDGRTWWLSRRPKRAVAAALLDRLEALWYGGATVTTTVKC